MSFTFTFARFTSVYYCSDSKEFEMKCTTWARMWHAINSIFTVFFLEMCPHWFIYWIYFVWKIFFSKNENEARPFFRIKLDPFSSICARYQLNIPNFFWHCPKIYIFSKQNHMRIDDAECYTQTLAVIYFDHTEYSMKFTFIMCAHERADGSKQTINIAIV